MKTGLIVTLIFVGIFSLFSTAYAEPKAAPTAEEEIQVVEGIVCANGNDERRLEAQTKGAGCVLFYTKQGKAQKIGEASRGVELCREKLGKVRSTLERAGYKCK